MDAAANKRSYIRLGAIRLLLKAISRTDVCMIYNRSDRMVRLWIEMFNRGGIDALATKKSDGRPRKVKMERLRDLLAPVLENPAQAGQRHWTGIKLHGWLLQQLQIDLGYRTVLRYLHELDYNLRVPRPWPDRQDEEKRAAFLLALRALRDTPCATRLARTAKRWSFGMGTNRESKAIPALGGAGLNAEAVHGHLILALTSVRTSLELFARKTDYRRQYNEFRPHSKLGYQSPAGFAANAHPASAPVGLRPPCAEAGQPTTH